MVYLSEVACYLDHQVLNGFGPSLPLYVWYRFRWVTAALVISIVYFLINI